MLVELFQKNQMKNLHVLTAITLNRANTIESLSTALNLSQLSTKRTLKILQEDLMTLFIERPILINQNNEFHLVDELHNNKFMPIIKLSNYYLEQSSTALLLKTIINKKKINIISLANILHISQSYCYTLIQQVNSALKSYEIQITTQDNIVQLTGEEIRIIFLKYYFQKWQYELDENLLLEFISRFPELANITNIDDSPMRLAIFIDVLKKEGAPQKISKHYNQTLLELQQIIQENQNYFTYENEPDTYEGKQLKVALNSTIHTWINRIQSPDDQVILADKMMTLPDNPITKLAQDLATSFIYRFKLEEFQKNDRLYSLLFFHLTINIMYIYQFRIDFSKMFYPKATTIFNSEKEYTSTVEYELIEKFITQVPIKSPIWEIVSQKQYYEIIYPIFYAAMNYSYRPLLKIFVDESASADGIYLFKQQLSHVYSTDFFKFVSSPIDADIVFIEHAKQIKTNGKIFLVFDLTTNQKWQAVFDFIMATYFEKLDKQTNQSVDNYFANSIKKA